MGRGDLSNEQWAVLEPLLPKGKKSGRPPLSWKRILAQLQSRADGQGLITWDVSVDSTVARAHQHAAGASKKGNSKRTSRAG